MSINTRLLVAEKDLATITRLLENIANQTQIQQLKVSQQSEIEDLKNRVADLEAAILELQGFHTP